LEYAKIAPIEIKGGLVDGQLFDLDQVEAFSKLPTRIELISKLMGTMQAPVQNFVAILNEVPTKFVRTLKAVADQKSE
jgi:large subunit ribosomal protein L10